MDRRKFLSTATVASTAGIALTLTSTSAFAGTARPGNTMAPAKTAALTDAQKDQKLTDILNALEAVPDDLKNADPATTPNYKERLTVATNGITVVEAPVATQTEAAQMGVGGCLLAVAVVIAEYGIPAAKVVSWIRKARATWGGVKGIIAAIQGGFAAAQIGEEAATVLMGILGLDSVVNACF
jgi:putative secreted protein